MPSRLSMFLGSLLFLQLLSTASAEFSAEDAAKATGVSRGVAAVIDTELETAAALAEGGEFVVHLLAPKEEKVGPLREEISKRGLGGRIVVREFAAGGPLPYADRFLNLLVAERDALPAAERLRVLSQRGAAYLHDNGKWSVEKPEADPRLDDWTHRWYDATGNCVSHDRLAAYPQMVQWQHGPAMEDGTADGKLPRLAAGLWVLIDSSSGDLVCRDADNGTLVWRQPFQLSPRDDLAIAAGCVYFYHEPSEGERDGKRPTTGPLVAIDLETGELVQTFEHSLRSGTAQPIEFEDRDESRLRRETPVPWFVVNEQVIVQAYDEELVVLDRATGEQRFTKKLEGATWFSPVVQGELLLAAESAAPARRGRHDGSVNVRAVTAFRATNGEQLWRNERVHPEREVQEKDRSFVSRAEFKPMSLSGDLVLLHASSYQFRQGGSVAVLEASSGRELWRQEFQPKERYTQGSQRAVIRGEEVALLDGLGALRFEARTGKPLGEPLTAAKDDRRMARANGACTASRATLDWLICNAYLYVGPEGTPQVNFGARGACGQGVIPANGLIYVPPTPCDCGDYARGHMALAPAPAGAKIEDEARLTIGPAYGETVETSVPREDEWPTFLGGPQRRSWSAAAPPAKLEQLWSTQAAEKRNDSIDADRRNSEYYLGALSAPVAAADLVLLAAPETHEVLALDAKSGEVRWRFAAGGKVDSPPTLANGLALFGCDDGSIYALHAATGRLAWKFRAGPREAASLHNGHLASAYPLPGSVLVLGDTVFAVAGHHTDLGGLHAWALELATGKPRARRTIVGDQPRVVTNGVAVADAEGTGFWIGQQLHLAFDLSDLPTASFEGPKPPISFDRNGTRLRFRTAQGRGGSTHGWKGAMQVLGRNRFLRAHRLALSEELGFGLRDPESPNQQQPMLWGTKLDSEEAEPLWQRAPAELGTADSYGALLAAGDRLFVGGGSRHGDSGVLHAVDAASGRLLQSVELPARVTECGLALAGGRLYVTLENGVVVCLGEER